MRLNLALMTYMWLCSSLNFYMVMFELKYWPGSIYTNTIASGLSDALATLTGGYIYAHLKFRKTFTVLYMISLVGGLLLLFLGE